MMHKHTRCIICCKHTDMQHNTREHSCSDDVTTESQVLQCSAPHTGVVVSDNPTLCSSVELYNFCACLELVSATFRSPHISTQLLLFNCQGTSVYCCIFCSMKRSPHSSQGTTSSEPCCQIICPAKLKQHLLTLSHSRIREDSNFLTGVQLNCKGCGFKIGLQYNKHPGSTSQTSPGPRPTSSKVLRLTHAPCYVSGSTASAACGKCRPQD